MQYRRLGQSKLQVSALCLGTMMSGDQTGTADGCTEGASEAMWGGLIKGQRQDYLPALNRTVGLGHRSTLGFTAQAYPLQVRRA